MPGVVTWLQSSRSKRFVHKDSKCAWRKTNKQTNRQTETANKREVRGFWSMPSPDPTEEPHALAGPPTGVRACVVRTTVLFSGQAECKDNDPFSLSLGAVSGPPGNGQGPEFGAQRTARRRHSYKKRNGRMHGALWREPLSQLLSE